MSASSNPVISAQRLQVVRYTQVVSMTVLITEWFLIIGEEVEYVWKAKWTYLKVFYLMSRYSPFLDTPFTLLNYITPRIKPETCLAYYQISTVSTFVGMSISEYILLARTYALYGRSRKIGLILGIGIVICTMIGIVTISLFLTSLVFGPLPSPEIPGCLLKQGSDIVFVNFVILLIWEFLVVVLTAYRGIKSLRGSRAPLVQTLYRDGIFFFVCLLVLSTANIVVLIVAPLEYLDLLDTLTRCLHSIICCRVLLNLRVAAREGPRRPVTQPPRSTIRFGNLKFFSSKRSGSTTGDGSTVLDESLQLHEMSRSTDVEAA